MKCPANEVNNPELVCVIPIHISMQSKPTLVTLFGPTQVGVLALKVGHMGLKALQATSKALDLYEQVIEPHTSKQDGVQPPPPDTPQLLPSLHAIWSPLMGALQVHLHALTWHKHNIGSQLSGC